MSRRVDREAGKAKPLITNPQAHRALEDLMPVIEALTDADLLLQETQDGHVFIDTREGRYLREILTRFRNIGPDSPSIDAYMRWLERNTEEAAPEAWP